MEKNALSVYSFSDSIGGETQVVNDIVEHFGGQKILLWDELSRKKLLKTNWLVEKISQVVSALFGFEAERTFLKVFGFAFYKIKGNSAINLISTYSLAIPRGKNIIAYIYTPPRYFFVDYLQTREIIRKYSTVGYLLFPLVSFFSKLYYINTLSRCKEVICISKTTQKRLLEYTGIKAEVIYPIFHKENTTQKLAYSKFFLYLSRFSRIKRQDFVLRAFTTFYEQRRDFYLVLAGGYSKDIETTKFMDEITSYVRKNSIPVKILADINESLKEQLLAECYCTLYAASNEDLGLAPIESMSYRKPVIAIGEGGVTESVRDKLDGYIIYSEEEMAFRMEELASDIELTKKIGENCESRVKSEFKREIFHKDLETVFNSIIT